MASPPHRLRREPINIVVLGDSGVGKTSLVNTLASEFFEAKQHQKVLRPLHISVDTASGHEARLVIWDTEAPDALTKHFELGLTVDALILVFDAGNEVAFSRLSSVWLPSIAEARARWMKLLPVVLVESKIDVHRELQAAAAVAAAAAAARQEGSRTRNSHRASKQNEDVPPSDVANKTNYFSGGYVPSHERFATILDKFPNISACVACSAKRKLNVAEVFRLAAASSLFPTRPLLEMKMNRSQIDKNHETPNLSFKLSLRFEVALKRIFRMADALSCDGVLSASEYYQYVQSCFRKTTTRNAWLPPSATLKDDFMETLPPMSGNDVSAFKELIKSLQMVNSDFVAPTFPLRPCAPGSTSFGVTLSGWIFINHLFLERNRPENTWAVLHRYGYHVQLGSIPAQSSISTITLRSSQINVPSFAMSALKKVRVALQHHWPFSLMTTKNRWWGPNTNHQTMNRKISAVGDGNTAMNQNIVGGNHLDQSENGSHVELQQCQFSPRLALRPYIMNVAPLHRRVTRGDEIELTAEVLGFLTRTFYHQHFNGGALLEQVELESTFRMYSSTMSTFAAKNDTGDPSAKCKDPSPMSFRESNSPTTVNESISSHKTQTSVPTLSNQESSKSAQQSTATTNKTNQPRTIRASEQLKVKKHISAADSLHSGMTTISGHSASLIHSLINYPSSYDLNNWLATWQMSAALEPVRTIQVLRLLGVPDPRDNSLYIPYPNPRVLHPRSGKILAQSRRVFRCFVFGARGVGKTSVIHSIVQQNSQTEHTPNSKSQKLQSSDKKPPDCRSLNGYQNTCVATKNGNVCLILSEIPASMEDNVPTQNIEHEHISSSISGSKYSNKSQEQHSIDSSQHMELSHHPRLPCDLYLFVWDKTDPRSLRYLKSLQARLRGAPKVPCLYLCNERTRLTSINSPKAFDIENHVVSNISNHDSPSESSQPFQNEICGSVPATSDHELHKLGGDVHSTNDQGECVSTNSSNESFDSNPEGDGRFSTFCENAPTIVNDAIMLEDDHKTDDLRQSSNTIEPHQPQHSSETLLVDDVDPSVYCSVEKLTSGSDPQNSNLADVQPIINPVHLEATTLEDAKVHLEYYALSGRSAHNQLVASGLDPHFFPLRYCPLIDSSCIEADEEKKCVSSSDLFDLILFFAKNPTHLHPQYKDARAQAWWQNPGKLSAFVGATVIGLTAISFLIFKNNEIHALSSDKNKITAKKL